MVASCWLLVWGVACKVGWEGETRRVGRNVSAGTKSRATLGIRACKCLDSLRCFKCEIDSFPISMYFS